MINYHNKTVSQLRHLARQRKIKYRNLQKPELMAALVKYDHYYQAYKRVCHEHLLLSNPDYHKMLTSQAKALIKEMVFYILEKSGAVDIYDNKINQRFPLIGNIVNDRQIRVAKISIFFLKVIFASYFFYSKETNDNKIRKEHLLMDMVFSRKFNRTFSIKSIREIVNKYDLTYEGLCQYAKDKHLSAPAQNRISI